MYTVQCLLTATPEKRPEPITRPNSKVPPNFAFVLMVSLLLTAVMPVIRITASSCGTDPRSKASITVSGHLRSDFHTRSSVTDRSRPPAVDTWSTNQISRLLQAWIVRQLPNKGFDLAPFLKLCQMPTVILEPVKRALISEWNALWFHWALLSQLIGAAAQRLQIEDVMTAEEFAK